MEPGKKNSSLEPILEVTSKKRKITKNSEKNLSPVVEKSQPRRKRGVTETPDMNVVIGYNLGFEGKVTGGIPRILLNAEPLPDRETINKGLPDFEGVDECRRVIFRHVPGNDFFFELIKTNAEHERLFLVCEPKEGNKMLNLTGRNFNILFLGREGKEVLAIHPCPNTKETVSIVYKQYELGRIIRHSSSDSSEASHSILDRNLKKVFILRKSFQELSITNCCFMQRNKMVESGYDAFAIKKSESCSEEVDVTPLASISDSEIKFHQADDFAGHLEIEDKILLLSTLVSIKTKAMETAGIAYRISLAFPNIN